MSRQNRKNQREWKRREAEDKRYLASLPLALDWPADKPFIMVDKNGIVRPDNQTPYEVKVWLQVSALHVALQKWQYPETRALVDFYQWELALIAKGYAPIPHADMEEIRAKERYGRRTPEYEAACKGEYLTALHHNHFCWGAAQYWDLWPEMGDAWGYHQDIKDEYARLKAEGYGENWYALDYSTLPSLDPATLLPANAHEPPPDPRIPLIQAPGQALLEAAAQKR